MDEANISKYCTIFGSRHQETLGGDERVLKLDLGNGCAR